MPDNLSDEKKTELWKAFHTNDLYLPNYQKAIENQLRLAQIQGFYDTDSAFRTEIDDLRKKMQKKKIKKKMLDKKISELLQEAEYRRYISNFGKMRQNYEARKKTMTHIQHILQVLQ